MRIIERGSLPEPKKAIVRCHLCSTQFEVQQSECTFDTDERGTSPAYHVTCPLPGCGETIYIAPRRFE